MELKKYVPRSIQNIFDRLEAFNESIAEKLYSKELDSTFEVVVYCSKSPETDTQLDTSADLSPNVANYNFFKARSTVGHHDLLVQPERARSIDEYERLRNMLPQAILKKSTNPFPKTGDVWLATKMGAGMLSLISFERNGDPQKFKIPEGDGPAQAAHTNGQNPTTSVGTATASATTNPAAASTQLAQAIVNAYPMCPPDLANKIVEVAKTIGTHPYYLANLINFESARTFSAAKDNGVDKDSAGIGYIGLIQFGNGAVDDFKSRKDPNISKTKLKNMTEVEQMDWVEFYLQMPHKRKGSDYKSSIDLYMAVFYPAAVGKPNYMFPQNVINANNGIDTPTEYARRANASSQLSHNVQQPWNLS